MTRPARDDPSSREQAGETPGTQPRTGHHIVVGVNGSAASLASVEWLARQVKLTGADLGDLAVRVLGLCAAFAAALAFGRLDVH